MTHRGVWRVLALESTSGRSLLTPQPPLSSYETLQTLNGGKKILNLLSLTNLYKQVKCYKGKYQGMLCSPCFSCPLHPSTSSITNGRASLVRVYIHHPTAVLFLHVMLDTSSHFHAPIRKMLAITSSTHRSLCSQMVQQLNTLQTAAGPENESREHRVEGMQSKTQLIYIVKLHLEF